MQVARPRPCNHIHLPARGAAGLSVVYATDHAKLADGVDAGEREQCEVGAAVDVVSTVDLPIVFLPAVAVNLKSHHVGANRSRSSREDLVGVAGIGSSRHQKHQLRVVAAVERKLAQLHAGNHARGGGALCVDLQGVGLYTYGFTYRTNFKCEIYRQLVTDVQYKAAVCNSLESGDLDRNRVMPNRQKRRCVLAVFVGRERAHHDLPVRIGDRDLGVGHDTALRVRHRARDRARNFLRRCSSTPSEAQPHN